MEIGKHLLHSRQISHRTECGRPVKQDNKLCSSKIKKKKEKYILLLFKIRKKIYLKMPILNFPFKDAQISKDEQFQCMKNIQVSLC